MDNENAKLKLNVYRPNGQDAGDPFFTEALKQVEQDPAMGAWHRDQQLFDTQVAAALATLASPAHAKTSALTGMDASGSDRPRRWWPFALAASLAVLLSLGLLVQHQRQGKILPGTTSLARIALNLADPHPNLGLVSDQLPEVRQWLADRNAPAPGELPASLAGMQVIGCETWDRPEGKVSLLCLLRDGVHLHLFVFDSADLQPGLPGPENPQWSREAGWSLASWQSQGRAYMLAAPADSGLPLESLFRI